jgi:hypothetical protein
MLGSTPEKNHDKTGLNHPDRRGKRYSAIGSSRINERSRGQTGEKPHSADQRKYGYPGSLRHPVQLCRVISDLGFYTQCRPVRRYALGVRKARQGQYGPFFGVAGGAEGNAEPSVGEG